VKRSKILALAAVGAVASVPGHEDAGMQGTLVVS
jgi:hypothetical protein